MTPLELVTAQLEAVTAREVAELATLGNALQTASDDSRPVFADAASRAASSLIQTRTLIAGLTTLIEELTPAPEGGE
jgi:hypothetical protein